MNYKLEVVVIPVTDVDRAKAFYTGALGFRLDADTEPRPGFRVVHMTPPGSACSVVVGPVTFDPAAAPATRAMFQLVVEDIEAARTELLDAGVQASEVDVLSPRDGGKFFYLADPDGNGWAVQEIRDHNGAEL